MRAARGQRGAALMALVAVLVMAVLAGLVSLVNAALSRGTTDRNHNAAVLQQAKTALIGYVAKEVLNLRNSIPGRLPCPESPGVAGIADNEGIAAGFCAPSFAVQKTVGRLPWRTLGIDKLVDAHAEPLWYAVSPNWVYNNSGTDPVINASTGGQLSVDGTTDVVAVIIAPGAPISSSPNAAQIAQGCAAPAPVQQRSDRSHVASSGSDPDYRNYLECQNATFNPDAAFGTSVIDNATNVVLNDQIVYVTAKDILNAMQGPLAERVQRTVAPLLSEHRDKWTAALGAGFLPYAVSFDTPETSTATCGNANVREGFLPTADTTTAGCASTWQNFSITGTGNGILPATPDCTGGATVTCVFRYYTLNPLGAFLNIVLNLAGLSHLIGTFSGTGALIATISADAPNVALAFRDPLLMSQINVTQAGVGASGTLTHTMALVPKPSGEATLAIQVSIASGSNQLCTSLVALVCNLLPGLAANEQTVTVTFPQVSNATVQGTQLSAAVMTGVVTPMSLVNPVARTSPDRDDPHFWFFSNQWHRFTYYSIAPTTSADQTGGMLTVAGFPVANGSANDKSFVLALMGPAVIGQVSRPSAQVGQYLEGENTSPGDNIFAYVFPLSGNDRIVACPFSAGGTTVCN